MTPILKPKPLNNSEAQGIDISCVDTAKHHTLKFSLLMSWLCTAVFFFFSVDDQGGIINPDPSKTDSGVAVALRFHLFSLKMEKTQSDTLVLECQGKTVV